MDYLRFIATQQAIVWVVFSAVAYAGALAQRRWGVRASVAAVILSWPIFVGTALLNEVRTFPQVFELNSFGMVFRQLWVPPTLATVALAVVLWLTRRVPLGRGLVVRSVGAGAAWAFVMPVPIMIGGLFLASVIPMGKAEYHYVDFRPMGLTVLEAGTPTFRGYSGDSIPLRYRGQLDGRELEIEIVPVEASLTAQFRVRAIASGSPPFSIDPPPFAGGCGFAHVRPRDNVVTVQWSTVPESLGVCYGEGAPDVEVAIRFVGGEVTLRLTGPIVKAGEYYFYDSL